MYNGNNICWLILLYLFIFNFYFFRWSVVSIWIVFFFSYFLLQLADQYMIANMQHWLELNKPLVRFEFLTMDTYFSISATLPISMYPIIYTISNIELEVFVIFINQLKIFFGVLHKKLKSLWLLHEEASLPIPILMCSHWVIFWTFQHAHTKINIMYAISSNNASRKGKLTFLFIFSCVFFYFSNLWKLTNFNSQLIHQPNNFGKLKNNF